MQAITTASNNRLTRVVIAVVTVFALSAALAAASAQAWYVVGTNSLPVYGEPNQSAALGPILRYHQSFEIVCQTRGANYVAGRASTMWDKISGPASGFISDWYTNTSRINEPTPGLATCNEPPPGTNGVGAWHSYQRSLGNFQYSNYCIDDSAYSQAWGNQMQLWTCVGNGNQHWRLLSGYRFKLLQNETSGLCLDVAGGNPANGASAIQWPCNYFDPAQRVRGNWYWGAAPDFIIEAAGVGTCLDDPGRQLGNGVKLWFWQCNKTPAQSWAGA